MTDLYWIYSFIKAFTTTVVVSCAAPSNWEHCFPVTPWLVPWIHDAIHLVEDGAYHQERMDLKDHSSSLPN